MTFCASTLQPRMLLWMPQGWTFRRQRSIADVLVWAVWYGLGLIQCSACKEFRNSKDKLFYKLRELSLAGKDECSARGQQELHAKKQTACLCRCTGSHFNTLTNAYKMQCTHFQGQAGNFPASEMSATLREKHINAWKLSTKFISKLSWVTYAKHAHLQCCCLPRAVFVSLESHFLSEEQKQYFKWNTQETCGWVVA